MALSNITDIKALLNITDSSKDDILQNMLDAITQDIQDYCDRTFEDADFTELINAKENVIFLRNRPINNIWYVGTDVQNAIKLKYTGTSVATARITTTSVVLTSNYSATTLLFSNYATNTLLTAAIEAVSDWEATLIKDGSPRTLYSDIYTFAQNDENYITMPLYTPKLYYKSDGYYYTDSVYPHLVIYNGGYTTLPQDLIELVNKLTITLYYDITKTSGGTLDSEHIGNYSYTNSKWDIKDASATLINSPQFMNILNKYRNMVI